MLDLFALHYVNDGLKPIYNDQRIKFNTAFSYSLRKGGATVLKVGRQFCERSEPKKIFDPPLFGQWGGTKYCLDS